jgi:hypothetical protein
LFRCEFIPRTSIPTEDEPCDLSEKFPVKVSVADSWSIASRLLFCGPRHLQLAGSSDTQPCLLPTAGTEWIWESWNYLPRSLCLTARRRALWRLGHFCTQTYLNRGLGTGVLQCVEPRDGPWTLLSGLMLKRPDIWMTKVGQARNVCFGGSSIIPYMISQWDHVPCRSTN